jgi:hypothetical protein
MKRRLKELLAMMMIGEGVIAAIAPRRHTLLWNTGPRPLRRLVVYFARRPQITRILGAAEVGLGYWLARRQLAR